MPLDRSRKRTPGENIAEQQEPAQMVGLKSKSLATEGDVPVTSSKDGLPRKRARVEPEDISSPRNRPHRSKKDTPVSKPRKATPPSRVQKTYRNRQKIERSSGHRVNRDVDYDEIPPSTAAVHSPTMPPKKSSDDISMSRVLQVKGIKGKPVVHGSPMVGPWPMDETSNDKRQEKGKPNQTDTSLIQVPPTEVILDDDDPIRSFSSSPSEQLSSAVDAVKALNSLHLIRISCLNYTAWTPSLGPL